MTNLLDLPEHITLYIVSLLAKSGVDYIGPLLASGPDGFRLCTNEYVLREAALGFMESTPVIVNRGTIFRPIFERTLFAQNPVAKYLEGLRQVVRDGPDSIRDAIVTLANPWDLLFGKQHPSSSKSFILTILLLCEGETEEGFDLMMKFRDAFNEFTEIEDVAQRVYNDMSMIAGEPYGRRRPRSLSLFISKIPTAPYGWRANCDKCGEDQLCHPCYTWWCIQKFKNMFHAP